MKISELPKGERELALLRQKQCEHDDYDKQTDDLVDAFDWSATSEDYDYWNEWDNQEIAIIQPKNYDDVLAIIETKIATMSSRGFESYYLPIGILKDLIREIKEIK